MNTLSCYAAILWTAFLFKQFSPSLCARVPLTLHSKTSTGIRSSFHPPPGFGQTVCNIRRRKLGGRGQKGVSSSWTDCSSIF